MCRIASLFLLQRLKGSMSGEARAFNNIETRAVIKFFFFSSKAVLFKNLYNKALIFFVIVTIFELRRIM
jgi:hypothetical protein